MKNAVNICLGVIVAVGLAGCAGLDADKDTNTQPAPIYGSDDGQFGDTTVTTVANQHSFQGQSIGEGQQLKDAPAAVSQAPSSTNTIHFDFDKFTLNQENLKKVDAIADYLMKNPKATVVLAGYTDPRGSQEYNFHLGQKRANAVQDYMASKGVPSAQMCTVSYGELRPAANPADYGGDWKKAYALDRRVTIEYNQTCGSQH